MTEYQVLLEENLQLKKLSDDALTDYWVSEVAEANRQADIYSAQVEVLEAHLAALTEANDVLQQKVRDLDPGCGLHGVDGCGAPGCN